MIAYKNNHRITILSKICIRIKIRARSIYPIIWHNTTRCSNQQIPVMLGDSGGYVEAVSVIHGAQPRLTSEARRWCTSIISWMGRNLGPRSVGVGSRVEQSAYLSLFRDVRKRMWCKRSSFRVGARFKSSTTLKKGHPYTPCRVTQAEGERERLVCSFFLSPSPRWDAAFILILLLASLPAPSCHYFNKHVRGQCLSTLVIAVVGYIFARIALSFVEMITSNSINRHYFEDNEGTEG